MVFVRKDVIENIIKIVKCLKEAEDSWLWITEIGRRCNLHHKTVARLVDTHLTMFTDQQMMEPFNVRMIRLKPNTDINSIFRHLSVMQKLKGVKR